LRADGHYRCATEGAALDENIAGPHQGFANDALPGPLRSSTRLLPGSRAFPGIDASNTTPSHKGILPPKSGTILRVIDFPPEPRDAQELKRMLDARSDTVDYAIAGVQ
jgi:hypothetical protein